MSDAVIVENLHKEYRVGFLGRRVVAVEDISLRVPRGGVFGIVGPNGAGKSTTLAMLLGVAKPDRGNGSVLGLPLGDRMARRRIGFLPELPFFPRHLTAAELLDFHAQLAGVRDTKWQARRDGVLERVGLGRTGGVRLGGFSKGMLQRAGLAVALCAEPELVFLDEPMSGLDPVGRHDVRALIRGLRQAGCTVVFSSHVLSDVEALCDEIAIISQGRVYRAGRLEELAAGSTRAVEIRLESVPDGSRAALEALGPVTAAGAQYAWALPGEIDVNAALALALQHGVRVRAVQPQSSTLEELLVRAGREVAGEGRISPR